MILEDLIKEVEIHGGGDVIDDNYTITSLINRALRELYISVPVTKSVRFNIIGHKPVACFKEIVCKSGQSITIPLDGKAYSMRVMGSGNYMIMQDDRPLSASQFDTGNETRLVRGFLTGKGSIEFWGSFTFHVYDLSIFDEVYSPEVDSIPDGSPIATYDIRAMYNDFHAFVSPPTDRFGKAIKGCRLYDGRLEVSSDFSGEVLLTYRRRPSPVSYYEDNIDPAEEVDVNEEYITPLVYLIWYLYWYNTDENKAKIYKDRYESLLATVKSSQLNLDNNYLNENGWA